jgi:DNA-binding transcriptional LysR family regulator
MDQLTSLKVFLAVTGEGSFAAAADRLELSRAVVSKHVKFLEKQVNARLLERTTRRVALTDCGRAFHERAQRAVAELDEAMAEAAQAAAVPRGKVRMTCGLSFGLHHLSHAVSAFLARYPEVQVELDLSDRFVDLGEEGCDLAIRVGALPESTLVARRLATTQMLVCASPGYLARHGTPRRPRELRKHSCLLYAYRPQPKAWTFRRRGVVESVPVAGPVRANNGDFLRELALDGHGLVLSPSFIVGDLVASGGLVRVLADWDAGELGIHAVYPQRKFVPARVRALLDFLVGRFGDPAYWQGDRAPARVAAPPRPRARKR